MKKDLAKIYLNEARLAEGETWSNVDDKIAELKGYINGGYVEWKDKYSVDTFEDLKKLINLWEVHVVAATTLESMLGKTYGEIISGEDGDWYIKEDREKLLKEMEPKEKIGFWR